LLSITGLAALFLVPDSARAQSDSAAVMFTLDRFLAALRTKDTSAMRAELDSAARMTLLRPSPAGGVRVMVLTGDQFVNAAANPSGPALDEPIRNANVHVHTDLASVWAEYQVRIEGRVSHCGYDAFHLVRRGTAWKILNVSDTFRRENCGPPWEVRR